MAKYKYSARNKDGALIKGQIESKTRESAVETIQGKDLIIVDIEEDIGLSLEAIKEINIGGVPIKEKVIFMRQLSTMISASLPLTQALQILRDQAVNPKFKRVLGQVLYDIEGGSSLSKAFARNKGVFDDITMSLISAGENSGQLEIVMQRLALEMEKKKKLGERVRSAFIYPALIVVVIIAVIILLMTVLVPSMKEIYDDAGATLPWTTTLLINMSDFVLGYWYVIIIVLAVGGIFLKLFLDSNRGKRFFAMLAIKIPIFGKLMVDIQLSQFTRTLSLLLRSGLSIIEALRLTANSMSNIIFKEVILNARDEVEKGIPLSLPISRATVFPLIISQMISVGEETGKLDEVLEKMSEYYENEVDVATGNLSTLLEPVILLVMGVIIAFIAAAIYMPMFNLSGVMGA